MRPCSRHPVLSGHGAPLDRPVRPDRRTGVQSSAGRHRTAGVIFGEAAGKLIFIEYVFGQADLISGMSWPAIPLDGLPIPPIDNIHVLHFGTDESTTGRYTVHMYFLPEECIWAGRPNRKVSRLKAVTKRPEFAACGHSTFDAPTPSCNACLVLLLPLT